VKIMGYKKGQVTFANLIVLFVTFVLTLLLMPVMNTIIATTTVYLQAHPDDMTGLTVGIIQLIPFALIVMEIIYGIYLAVGKRGEQMQ